MSKYIQMNYKPINPEKYMGDINRVFCRSSYELVACRWLDTTTEIKKWNLEGIKIPYFDPVRRKQRIYVMDFVAEAIQLDGSSKVFLIEVKPSKSVKIPKKTAAMAEKTFTASMNLYLTNSAKWEAAKVYAEENGYTFLIWTEKDLLPGTASIKSTFKKKQIK